MGMQVTLFRALRNAKVGNHDAQAVVEELEGHIAVKITEANQQLVTELRIQRWALGFLAIVTTISAGIGGYVASVIH